MLGIVTPSTLSVEAVRKGFKTQIYSHSDTHNQISQIVGSVEKHTIKGNALLLERCAIDVVAKEPFRIKMQIQ